ncbi:MAG: type III pantothenate kinase [Pirellulales bacterium]|nr:type III pantothenate kinase [Pirellulales bacterium]
MSAQQTVPKESVPLVAVDVGNSRMKFGIFEACTPAAGRLPEPVRTLEVASLDEPLEGLASWLAPYDPQQLSWWIATVNLIASTRLIAWLRDHDASGQLTMLAAGDLDLPVRLDRPDMVGIDRLLASVAARQLTERRRPAVVVSLGSAITVNMVSADGAFCGGAILPGIGMSARALHEFTDLLPKLDMQELKDAPSALGQTTVDAMRSGLYWGAIGAVKELVNQLAAGAGQAPLVVLTGGAAPSVASQIAADAVHAPNLVLSGIALTAGR